MEGAMDRISSTDGRDRILVGDKGGGLLGRPYEGSWIILKRILDG
jgi:hypothetical protein